MNAWLLNTIATALTVFNTLSGAIHLPIPAAPIIEHPLTVAPVKQSETTNRSHTESTTRAMAHPNVQSQAPATFEKWVTPSAAMINIRTGPSTNEPILKESFEGETYPVVEKQGDWYKIALSTKQTGWIAGWVAQPAPAPSNASTTLAIGATVDSADTPLLLGPGTEFSTVSHIDKGAVVEPLCVSGDYAQVVVPNGKIGWLIASDLRWQGQLPSQLQSEQSATTEVQAESGLLSGKTVVIDPGHGGADTGAIGLLEPIYERDVNLAVAQTLSQKLKAAGARVILTRTTNSQFVSLADRTRISNENHADAFISIHQNMFKQNPSIHGAVTYFYKPGASETLAKDIEDQVNKEHPTDGSTARSGVDRDELYVLHHNTQPAALVEGCFLSNPHELTNSVTVQYQEELADELFRGLSQFLLDR